MNLPLNSAVSQLLDSHNIAYEVIEIPLSEDKKPIRNLEELLRAEGKNPDSVVRSLLFKTGSDNFVLLAVAGGGRADWATLRKQLNEKKLRMAEFDEVPEATGYVVGAVPPIALPEAITVLVDESSYNYPEIIIGSGVLGYALALRSDDLKTLLADCVTGQFVKD